MTDARAWGWSVGIAVAAHAALAVVPVRIEQAGEPEQIVDFDLMDAVALPEPEPEPEPEPVTQLPPGPPNPGGDPEVTSLESNRPVAEEAPVEPVPLSTGLPLEADELVDGSMAVRVGNTDTEGYDADVDPSEITGFVGGGAGGGDGDSVRTPPDREAELLRTFTPRYPDMMKAQGIEGPVTLVVEVRANGRAGQVKLVQGVHPELDQLAMSSMRRFRWAPARRDGRRVPSTTRITIRFKIRTGERSVD